MKEVKTFGGVNLPNIDISDLTGKLIVIEGTDGVGRSTQIEKIKEWLEVNGYAVTVSGWGRSPLIGRSIEQAKMGHSLNVYTFILLYLADFADRLEHEIIPALKAGYIVLSDRYIYTAFARGLVRKAEKDWLLKSFGFALVPDLVLYLKIKIKDLIPRVLNSNNLEEGYWRNNTDAVMDYWESGMDMKLGEDVYESFVNYQKQIIKHFDNMEKEFNFISIDATRSVEHVNNDLKKHILNLINSHQ